MSNYAGFIAVAIVISSAILGFCLDEISEDSKSNLLAIADLGIVQSCKRGKKTTEVITDKCSQVISGHPTINPGKRLICRIISNGKEKYQFIDAKWDIKEINDNLRKAGQHD